jgi:hypothetical protein
MITLAREKKTCRVRISARVRPISSFQNRVMMAMGKRVIFRAAKTFSVSSVRRREVVPANSARASLRAALPKMDMVA